jgi:multidrug resistance efflux pump
MESEIVATTEPNQLTDNPSAGIRRRTVLFSFVSLAAGLGLTHWIDRARFEHLQGFLQARTCNVVSMRDAQISEILVETGELISSGQPIVRITDIPFQKQLQAKRREIESLKIELAQCQAKLEVELDFRRQQVLDRIFEAKLKAAHASRISTQTSAPVAAKSQSPAGNQNLAQPISTRKPKQPYYPVDRSTVSRNGGRVSRVSAEPPAQLPQSEYDLCTRHVEDLERMNRDLPEKISRMMGVDLAQTNLDHAREELASLESQECQLTIAAKFSGLVGVFKKNVGDPVAPYEPIVQLLDEEQPFLVMQIPSSRVSDFRSGTLVNLVFPGKIAGKGRVVAIPPQTSSVPDSNSQGSESKIAVHIEPVGALWPKLPFGSVVEVCR